ncbi:D-hexose-6-phosphate mutarotase [Paraglaciecola aquimarina]|uniref:Putative glucose-6-phosphate 1-epimerase n=1 Tax=Paraglaciecola algarum TaxID=3050085 RepID=A0ABS9D4N1_9ALTE|nr:D-hexose-6-phosphate mutarotase [Paraglaciecola sp. G1-23]MCF2946661.1 D-hexose-6-phosphate mutarotase [Paraglaciecola sp. G1-23]
MLLTDSTSIITRENIQILVIDNKLASAEISLFGGHILSFIPKHDNRQRLWVSQNAVLNGKKAIRGGIPICWPWFGDHKDNQFSAHGYVRDQQWQIISSAETPLGTQVVLQPTSSSGAGFDGDTQLSLSIMVGKDLNIKLSTKNVGETSLRYNCALHTYFAIHDIHNCELTGLEGNYLDKTQNFDSFETPVPYKIGQETDRVHLHKAPNILIKDKDINTQVQSSGHDSIIVWNPWQDKSISMGDMADDSYLTMICVETAITQGQNVAAGETHVLEQVIS